MNKQAIKNYLLQAEMDKVNTTNNNYESYLKSNKIDGEQVIDLDDQSHLHESDELASSLDKQVHLHEQSLENIRGLNFDSKSEVVPGAIVETNNVNFVIGVSSPMFELEGKKFIGVSTEAPIYKCMEGKGPGDECVYNKSSFKIVSIH